jgi:hypothetical protein
VKKVPTIVEGVYRQGTIELHAPPPGLRDGPVRVILLEPEPPKPTPHYLTFGKYKGGRLSTPDDFQDAGWHGEPEFHDGHGE